MLLNLERLREHALEGTDGALGTLRDVQFDDETWTVRYLVVETRGGWLADREVLLPPQALEEPQWSQQTLRAGLSREQVEQSPPIEAGKPLSREIEETLFEYYGWEPWWGRQAAADFEAVAARTPQAEQESDAPSRQRDSEPAETTAASDRHLRSTDEVIGYCVRTSGGDRLGRVVDFVIDGRTWRIQSLVIEPEGGDGERREIATREIVSVNWPEGEVEIER